MPTSPRQHVHRDLIASRLPGWLNRASAEQRQAWFASARRHLLSSQQAHDELTRIQTPAAFCRPLLEAALKRDYPELTLNVSQQVLVRYHDQPAGVPGLFPERQAPGDAAVDPVGISEGLPDGFEPTPMVRVAERFTLLAAALRNFSADQAEAGGLEADCVFDPPIPGLTPAQFAATCRRLDLGAQYLAHCRAAYQHPEALRTELRDGLYTAALRALIEQHIEPDTHAMLQQVGHPALRWAGQTVQRCQLRLLKTAFYDGHGLSNLVVLKRADGRCLVISPDEPVHPVKEYASEALFKQALLDNLRKDGYQTYFSRFVAQRSRVTFFQRLNNAFVQAEPDLGLVLESVDTDLVSLMHMHRVTHLGSSASATVVPTQDLDDASAAQHLAFWENVGLQALNVGAFVVPGLGEVMAAVGAVQLLSEVCVGVDDWTHGQRAQAWDHFSSIADNLAYLTVGIGVGGAIAQSDFIDSLVPVADGTGHERLINPDLSAYRSTVQLPEGLAPNAQGQYQYQGRTFVSLGDTLFEQRLDAATGQWQLAHPRLDTGYPQAFTHNGEGAWQHPHEQPLAWQGADLLRRFGPVTDGLADSTLSKMVALNSVTPAQLRECHVHQRPMPALLLDTVQRYQVQRRIDQLIAEVRDGLPLGDGHDYSVPLLLKLARWPQDLGIRLTGEQGSVEYGPLTRFIDVSRDDFTQGRWGAKVAQALGPAALRDMLGDAVAPGEQTSALQQRLAAVVHAHREALANALYERRQLPLSPPARVLTQQAFDLPNAVANELVSQATPLQRRLLTQHNQVPMALTEAAEQARQALRLNRAGMGLIDVASGSPDSDRLAVGLLAHLPGWSATVRVELCADRVGGERLAMAGDESAASVKYVVKRQGHYQAFDAQGQELSGRQDLFGAVLAALPDSERQAMGLDIHQAGFLRGRLARLVATDRVRAQRLLTLRLAQPWMVSPWWELRRQEGYQTSGRLWRAVRDWQDDARLRALYPAITETQLQDITTQAIIRDGSLANGLRRLESEYAVLVAGLDEWVAGAEEVSRFRYQLARDKIKAAWRRETGTRHSINRTLHHTLFLSHLELETLPVITADFSHIHTLDLRGNELSEDPSLFLRRFPSIRALDLSSNQLTHLPEALKDMPQLRTLDINRNRLSLAEATWLPLSNQATDCQLRTLSMTDQAGPLLEAVTVTGATLAPLVRLPYLRNLYLSGNRLSFEASAFEQLGNFPALQYLGLNHNRIVWTPAASVALARLTRLSMLDLAHNPLQFTPAVGGLQRLTYLNLSNTGISGWPAGLSELMDQDPLHLSYIDLRNNRIIRVPELRDTHFAEQANAQLPTQEFYLGLADNPLTPASRERLRAAGFNAVEVLPPDPASVAWWSACSPATLERLAADRLLPETQTFYRLLDQVGQTADYRTSPDTFQQRMSSLMAAVLPEAQDPGVVGLAELRQQLFDQATLVDQTCGDGISLTLDQFETIVLAWRAVAGSQASGSAALEALYATGRQLFRLALVDDYAVKIALAREIRAAAEQARTEPLPALHPFDHADAGQLIGADADEVELRLKLRHALKTQLDLPAQPQMRYNVELSEATVADVAHAVLQEGAPHTQLQWMVLQPWWGHYVRALYAEPFEQLGEQWDNVLAHFEEAIDASSPFTLKGPRQAAALATLQGFDATLEWRDEQGQPAHVVLNEQQVLKAYDWIVSQRREAEAALVLSVSKEHLVV